MKRDKIIAIDFDGTIWDKDKKELLSGCENALRDLKDAGYVLVLWTCRNGNRLANAKNILKEHGLHDLFSAFNEHPPRIKLKYKTSAKLLAGVFIDDRNLGGFPGWKRVVDLLVR